MSNIDNLVPNLYTSCTNTFSMEILLSFLVFCVFMITAYKSKVATRQLVHALLAIVAGICLTIVTVQWVLLKLNSCKEFWEIAQHIRPAYIFMINATAVLSIFAGTVELGLLIFRSIKKLFAGQKAETVK